MATVVSLRVRERGAKRKMKASQVQDGFAACLAGLCILAGASRASAQDAPVVPDVKAACGSAFEQSQLLRRAGKLSDARSALLQCVRVECARAVREQCGTWLEEVEKATPSIIVQATIDGEDSSEVQVEMDGKKLTDSITGMSFDVDPGVHKLRFVNRGFSPVERTIVLREGEKLRSIQVAFQHPAPKPLPAPAPVAPPPPVQMERPVPVYTYALFGAAAAGAGGFAFFGLSGERRRKQLEEDCAPLCTTKDVTQVETYMKIADVSLGVGGAALAGALISLLTRPSRPVDSTKAEVSLVTGTKLIKTTLTLRF